MQIIKANHEELVINGIVPINAIAPKKKDGRDDSPDPLIRICHKVKKELKKEYDACVAYAVSRQSTAGDPSETHIRFYFSNTNHNGEAKIPKGDKKALEKAETLFCGLMSAKCAEKIQAYLDDLEFQTFQTNT